MNKNEYSIRLETSADYNTVENLTREAFYNLYIPGCVEHYLVHIMRKHKDFVPELDFVIELNGSVIGNIMYTKAKLADENGNKKNILTFGPVCIKPAYQRMGYGKMLMEHSFKQVISLGYDVIVIFGSPMNYVSRGFKSCKKYNVCIKDDYYPAAMLVKELKEGCLDRRKWYYVESSAYDLDERAAEQFDSGFEKMEKKFMPSQEEFYIHSHSKII